MRLASLAVLLAAGTALSGCAANQLDAIGNLSMPCTTTTQTLDCTGPQTPPPPTPPPVVVSPAPPPNTGNSSNATTGDATLVLESSNLVSDLTKPAITTLTGATIDPITGKVVLGTTASVAITTNTADSADWPKTKPLDEFAPGTAAGVGLGGTYNEYRAYNKSPGGVGVDEELQVWNWGDSYGTQYRDVTAGGRDATHQAWSFGGNYTLAKNVKTSGTANYKGQYTATAKTSGFGDPGVEIPYNNLWRIRGTTNIDADFGSGNVVGQLTPTSFIGLQKDGITFGDALAPDPANPGQYLFNSFNAAFMSTDVVINGKISTTTKDPLRPNAVTGTAMMDPNKWQTTPESAWIKNGSADPMYAGFFGANGNQITGIYSFDATTPSPKGGITSINQDGRAYISESGVFYGTCTKSTNGIC
jgi:hypothetical protein